MIHIRTESRESELDPGHFRNLGELLAAWQQQQPERMVVRELELDGQQYQAPDPALFDALSLSRSSEARIEAVSARSVALSSLESAAEYAPRVRDASLETALRFRSGRPDLAAPLLAELMDALIVLSSALAAAGAELGDAAAELVGLDSELDGCLAGLVGAHQRRDWIDLADGLEFELASLLDGWSERIQRVAPGTGAAA